MEDHQDPYEDSNYQYEIERAEKAEAEMLLFLDCELAKFSDKADMLLIESRQLLTDIDNKIL